jgi:hypothetical protein
MNLFTNTFPTVLGKQAQHQKRRIGLIKASYAIEPFLPSIYRTHNPDSTAFPPVRTLGFLPNNIEFAWTNATFDDFQKAARSSAKALFNVARSEGQSLQGVSLYPNYAIYDTPLVNTYGSNLPRLQLLQSQVDPHNVMALAGGWKF